MLTFTSEGTAASWEKKLGKEFFYSGVILMDKIKPVVYLSSHVDS